MRKLLLLILTIIFLSGCWNQSELTDRGFVMGCAIDETEEGKIQLTTQIYKPANGSNSEGASEQINITTEGDTIFEAVRDITAVLGRKANWSHMQSLIIGEKTAQQRNITEILDFFLRDDEPRALMGVLIGKGEGKPFLSLQPLIENNIGRELFSIAKKHELHTGKTIMTDLFHLNLQLKGEVSKAKIPYIEINQEHKTPLVNGVALFKDGLMATHLPGEKTQFLTILLEEFDRGVIEVPCEDEPNKKENIEVVFAKTDLSTRIKGEQIMVDVNTHMEAAIGELTCTSVETTEEMEEFEAHIAQFIETELQSVITELQQKQLDVLGVGNSVYRRDPKLWKEWEETWDERFENSKASITVIVKIESSGGQTSIPFSQN